VSLFEHRPHPSVARRRAAGPVTVAGQHPAGSAVARFNTALALGITRMVGSMWCAYVFAALALVSLPDAVRGGTATLVSWIAQTFLQLVLLAVIMVGQNVQAAAADARSQATYDDAEAILHAISELAAHLAAQDDVLTNPPSVTAS
jgi:hypothetical protein